LHFDFCIFKQEVLIMATQAQIIANRRNAQRSTGPLTPRGKALASQNSLKHGLLARRNVIAPESQADYDLYKDQILGELNPLTPMESMLADRIVSLSWRLKRADLTQNQTFDAMHEKNTNNSLANIAKSFGLKGLGFPQDETSDSNPDLILGRIAIKDFSNARVLDRLLMYERRIEHSLFKTMLELQRLRLLRNLESSEPNLEPEDPHSAPAPVPPGRLHYAKRTQFENSPDDPNTIQNKHLQQHQPSPPPKKRTQSNPIYRGKACDAAGANPIHLPQSAIQTSIPAADFALANARKKITIHPSFLRAGKSAFGGAGIQNT
jgi:hypothetical protein